jgi:hypothetical protein
VLPHASIDDIPHDVQAAIRTRLDAVERAQNVRIVLAVDDYAALFAPRDVIDMPIEGDLDVNGWDLGKALIALSAFRL